MSVTFFGLKSTTSFLMRSWYACAVGQCAQVKTMTRMSAFAKLLSV
jgi:hypothetical protein